MRLALFTALTILFQFNLTAQTTYTSQGGGGGWSSITYSPLGTPGASDTVILDNSTNIFDASNVTFAKLIIKDASAITLFAGNSITVDSLILEGSASGSNILLTPGVINAQHIVFKGTNTALATIQFNNVASTLNLTGSLFYEPLGSFTGSQSAKINLSGTNNQSIRSNSGLRLDLSGKTSGTVSLTSAVSISNAVTIPSGVTLNSSSFTISGTGSLTVSNGATLEVGGSFPTITTTTLNSGSIVNYSGAGQTVVAKDYHNITFSGSGTKTCNSGVNVYGIASVESGATLSPNGNMTIKSNASGTGGLGEIQGALDGSNLVVERYVDSLNGPANPGQWYFIGAPVAGQTIAGINDDVTTTGFPNSDYPSSSFVSVVRWNGSAYGNPTDVSNSMNPGEGWFVYMGSNTPSLDVPLTIDWTGAPDTGNVVFSSSGGDVSISGTLNEFSSIANPYPCAVNLDLTSMPNSNVGNPYRISADGTFSEVTSATVLGLGEGFYLETTGGSPSLTFRESDKVTTQEANSVFNKSGKSSASSATLPRLTVFTTKINGIDDYCYLQLDDSKSLGIEYPYDFDKYENFNGYTNVFFKMSGHDVHINNIPSNVGAGVTIPIHLSRAYPGNVNVNLPFRIEGVEDFRANGICLSLENPNTNTTIPLDKDYSTTLTWNDTDTNAIFYLHLSKAYDEVSTDASCYGFDDGTVTANMVNLAKYDFYLTNLIGDTLQSELGYVGNSYTFNNVKAGDYKIVVNDPNGCGMLARSVKVAEPDPVVSLFTTKTNKVDLTFNPNITFNNISANAQSYFWRFGDGNTSSDDSPTHAYQDTGMYNVEMIALNGTCTDTSSKIINVIKSGSDVGIIEVDENPYLSLFQKNENVEVRFDLPNREKVNAQLFNAIGQQVWSSFGNTYQNEQIMLELPEANTFYILNIKGETFETNYKLIRK